MFRSSSRRLQHKAIDRVILSPGSYLSDLAGSGASRYRKIIAMICLPGFFICLNGGVWQLFRRQEKIQQLVDCRNLSMDPLKELPNEENPAAHMQPIVLEGTFDNEGSILVGPRPRPDTSTRTKGDNTPGGFYVMTPFEIAHTRQVVMVNRGWVPVDAAKSRLHLVQYIGEGFKRFRLRGIMRRQEVLSTKMGKQRAENFAPRPGAMSWDAFRPKDQALAYFRRRFGMSNMVERQSLHGAHTFYIEMIEDHSGDDQVLIKDGVYPFRRDDTEFRYQKLTSASHFGYAVFWFAVMAFFGTSIVGMKAVVMNKVTTSKTQKALATEQVKAMKASKDAYLKSDFYKKEVLGHDATKLASVSPMTSKAAPPDTNCHPGRSLPGM